MHLFLLRVYFFFLFQRTLSLKSCIKQPKSYLKSKKIEIRFIRSFYFMQFLQITCEINISLKVVPRRCSINKVFLKISQNSLEITCAGIFLIIMLHAVALVPRREYTILTYVPTFLSSNSFYFSIFFCIVLISPLKVLHCIYIVVLKSEAY